MIWKYATGERASVNGAEMTREQMECSSGVNRFAAHQLRPTLLSFPQPSWMRHLFFVFHLLVIVP